MKDHANALWPWGGPWVEVLADHEAGLETGVLGRGAPIEQIGWMELLEHRRVADRRHRAPCAVAPTRQSRQVRLYPIMTHLYPYPLDLHRRAGSGVAAASTGSVEALDVAAAKQVAGRAARRRQAPGPDRPAQPAGVAANQGAPPRPPSTGRPTGRSRCDGRDRCDRSDRRRPRTWPVRRPPERRSGPWSGAGRRPAARAGSPRTSYARAIRLNRRSSAGSPSCPSGWVARARRRKAALISRCVAVDGTPSVA